MVRPFYLLAIALLFLCCCQTREDSINKFSDPIVLKIAELQDRRLADSLDTFLDHPEALYRKEAALAFGSVQDPQEIDRIGKLLLMDPAGSVRKAAAFALGQIGHPSCERILLAAIVKEKDPEIMAEILQAYGQTTRRWQLDPNAFHGDTVKTAGLAWSLYRAGLRGKTDSIANKVAATLLADHHAKATRLGASHFFSRGAIGFDVVAKELTGCALRDSAPSVRMAAVLALGKIPSDNALVTLKEVIKSDGDNRVIINAARALRSFPFAEIKNYLYELLHHKDVNVGIAASEVIIETVPAEAWIEVSSLTNVIENWRIKANLYEAALKAGRNKDLAAEVQRRFNQSSDPYERAALLGSLKHFFSAYPFVEQSLRNAESPVIRSSAAGALVAMNQHPDFPRALAPRFAALYRDLFVTEKDPAVLGSIALALADSTLGYNHHIADATFLYTAAEKLSLPEHNEALQAIEAAIARLENRSPKPVKNEFNHPIDWDLVKTIPSGQLATIRTTRGSIVIRLLVNEAPGTVANFVKLAQRNYFDDRNVHRVVPNFVVQDGCKRGDGWGSEDYSIRSEFSPRPFLTGGIGMASAGKDTEGTQWFITHSPAPHLDGRYTLFAEVTAGQAVVDYLQVGDQITDVEIENFTDQ